MALDMFSCILEELGAPFGYIISTEMNTFVLYDFASPIPIISQMLHLDRGGT